MKHESTCARITRKRLLYLVANDCTRVVLNHTGSDSLFLTGKILGNERQWCGKLLKILLQHCQGLVHLGIGPVITDTITQAVCPRNAHLACIAMVVCFPILWTFNHNSLDDSSNVRTPFRDNPLLFNPSEAKDCFPHHVCQFRTNLQDAEMVIYELAERLGMCAEFPYRTNG